MNTENGNNENGGNNGGNENTPPAANPSIPSNDTAPVPGADDGNASNVASDQSVASGDSSASTETQSETQDANATQAGSATVSFTASGEVKGTVEVASGTTIADALKQLGATMASTFNLRNAQGKAIAASSKVTSAMTVAVVKKASGG